MKDRTEDAKGIDLISSQVGIGLTVLHHHRGEVMRLSDDTFGINIYNSAVTFYSLKSLAEEFEIR